MKKSTVCVCLLLAFAFILSLCGCDFSFSDAKQKLIRPMYVGSAVYFYGGKGNYKIDGLGTTKELAYENENYVFASNGDKTFDVFDEKNAKVCTVNAFEKWGNERRINLDEEDIYYITIDNDDVCSVRITSNSVSKSHQFAINVIRRTKPLIVTFDNVYVNNLGEWPVISNYTDASLEIKYANSVKLQEGKSLDGEEASHIAEYSASVFCGLYEFCSSVKPEEILKQLAKNFLKSGDFFKAITDYQNALNACTDTFLNGCYGLMFGDNGADGLSGLPAIISGGNIHISGEGSFYLSGGDGGNGGKASGSLFGSSNGGKGGNANYAIIADSILIESQDNISIKEGQAGKGGRGGISIRGEEEGYPGGDGWPVRFPILYNYLFYVS